MVPCYMPEWIQCGRRKPRAGRYVDAIFSPTAGSPGSGGESRQIRKLLEYADNALNQLEDIVRRVSKRGISAVRQTNRRRVKLAAEVLSVLCTRFTAHTYSFLPYITAFCTAVFESPRNNIRRRAEPLVHALAHTDAGASVASQLLLQLLPLTVALPTSQTDKARVHAGLLRAAALRNVVVLIRALSQMLASHDHAAAIVHAVLPNLTHGLAPPAVTLPAQVAHDAAVAAAAVIAAAAHDGGVTASRAFATELASEVLAATKTGRGLEAAAAVLALRILAATVHPTASFHVASAVTTLVSSAVPTTDDTAPAATAAAAAAVAALLVPSPRPLTPFMSRLLSEVHGLLHLLDMPSVDTDAARPAPLPASLLTARTLCQLGAGGGNAVRGLMASTMREAVITSTCHAGVLPALRLAATAAPAAPAPAAAPVAAAPPACPAAARTGYLQPGLLATLPTAASDCVVCMRPDVLAETPGLGTPSTPWSTFLQGLQAELIHDVAIASADTAADTAAAAAAGADGCTVSDIESLLTSAAAAVGAAECASAPCAAPLCVSCAESHDLGVDTRAFAGLALTAAASFTTSAALCLLLSSGDVSTARHLSSLHGWCQAAAPAPPPPRTVYKRACCVCRDIKTGLTIEESAARLATGRHARLVCPQHRCDLLGLATGGLPLAWGSMAPAPALASTHNMPIDMPLLELLHAPACLRAVSSPPPPLMEAVRKVGQAKSEMRDFHAPLTSDGDTSDEPTIPDETLTTPPVFAPPVFASPPPSPPATAPTVAPAAVVAVARSALSVFDARHHAHTSYASSVALALTSAVVLAGRAGGRGKAVGVAVLAVVSGSGEQYWHAYAENAIQWLLADEKPEVISGILDCKATISVPGCANRITEEEIARICALFSSHEISRGLAAAAAAVGAGAEAGSQLPGSESLRRTLPVVAVNVQPGDEFSTESTEESYTADAQDDVSILNRAIREPDILLM